MNSLNKTSSFKSGFSLVELIVALGILAIISLAVGGLLTMTQKNYSEMSEKATFLDYQFLSTYLLSKNETCNCHFQNLVFNNNNPAGKTVVPSLRYNCNPGTPIFIKDPSTPGDPNLDAQEIYFTNSVSTGNSNEYISQLIIKPKKKSSSVDITPIPIPFNFHTDPASPNGAKIILGCGKAPLSVPTGLASTAGNTQCSVSWQASGGAVPITYQVRKSTSAGQASTGSLACSTTGTSCLALGLTNNTPYYFSIQASNPYETTAFSAEVTCTPIEPASTPANLVTNPSGANTCLASWTAASGTPPISYEVRYSTTAGQAASGTVGCTTTNTNCSINSLAAGNTYYFAVRSSNALGFSSFSAERTCSPLSSITSTIVFRPDLGTYSVIIPAGYSSFKALSIDWLPAGGMNTTSTFTSGSWVNVWNWPCDNGNWLNLLLSGTRFYVQARGDEDCNYGWRHSNHTLTFRIDP